MLSGRTRQGKLVHFAAPGAAPAPGALALVTVTGGHPHHLSGRLEEVTARPALPRAHPGGQRLNAVALVGVTASGKSAAALALATRRGDTELVSVDSMCVYRGMDIGTSKPDAGGPGRRPASPARPGRARPGFRRDRVPGRGPAGVGGHRGSWPSRRARRRHRAVPARRGRPPRDSRPLPRGGGGASRPSSTTVERNRPICMPACRHSTRWPRPGWSPPIAAGSCGRSR